MDDADRNVMLALLVLTGLIIAAAVVFSWRVALWSVVPIGLALWLWLASRRS